MVPWGAMTLSKMTSSITPLSIINHTGNAPSSTTFSTQTLRIIPLSIITLIIMTLSLITMV
jgi:hypothetical protein